MSQSYQQAQEAMGQATVKKKRKISPQDETPPTSAMPQQSNMERLGALLNQSPSVLNLAELEQTLKKENPRKRIKRIEEPEPEAEIEEEEALLSSSLSTEGGMTIAEQTPPYYGPFTTGGARTFWKSEEEPTGTLAERLKQTPKLIEAGLKKELQPEFWGIVNELLYGAETSGESNKIETEQEEQESATADTSLRKSSEKATDTPSRKSSRWDKRTGAEAGKDFVTNVVPIEIARAAPEFKPVPSAQKQYEPKKLPAPEPNRPGYVLNMPAHFSKPVDEILLRYDEKALKGATDLPARVAAVIGINMRFPLEGDGVAKITEAVKGVNASTRFRYGVFGFLWAPEFSMRKAYKPQQPTYTFQDVIDQYNLLPDDAAKEYVRKHLYRGEDRSGQKLIAYGTFREAVANHPYVNEYVGLIGEVADPVYLHVGDPDAMSWVVNNDESVGVLTRYDEIIGAMNDDEDPEATYPPIIVGGYNFGEPSAADDVVTALCKVGNVLDRAIRRSIAAVVPEALYATEPNLLVKVLDDKENERARQWVLMKRELEKGSLFRQGDAEGNELKLTLARVLDRKRSEQTFAPYVDATIMTEIPDRILKSAASHPRDALLNLIQQKQSYATAAHWTGIGYKDTAANNAKQYVETTLRGIFRELITRAGKPQPQALSLTGERGDISDDVESQSSEKFHSQPSSGSTSGGLSNFGEGFGGSFGGSFGQTPLFPTRSKARGEEESTFDTEMMQIAKQESFELAVNKTGLSNYVEVHNASDKGDNCLIYSIAGALGLTPVAQQIENIRRRQEMGVGVLENNYLTTAAIPDILKEFGRGGTGVAILSTQQEGIDGWFPAEFIPGGDGIFLINAADIHFGWAKLLPSMTATPSPAPEQSPVQDTGIRFTED